MAVVVVFDQLLCGGTLGSRSLVGWAALAMWSGSHRWFRLAPMCLVGRSPLRFSPMGAYALGTGDRASPSNTPYSTSGLF